MESLPMNLSNIDFEKLGNDTAEATKSNPISISNGLDTMYQKYLESQKLDKDGIANKIKLYEDKKLSLENEKIGHEGEVKKQEELQAELNKKISGFKDSKSQQQRQFDEEIFSVKNGDLTPTDKFEYYLVGAILVALTAMLYLFYTAVIYASFEGIKGTSYINPELYSDLADEGFFMAAFYIILPVFVLAIGVLIHSFIKKKNKIGVAFVIIFAFFLDVILGYNIAKIMYINEFNAGLVEDHWTHVKAIESTHFWIVLFLGFVAYLFWGFLLSFFLEQRDILNPDQQVARKIQHLKGQKLKMEIEFDSKCDENNKLLQESKNVEIQRQTDIAKIKQEINNIIDNINYLKSGVITISLVEIESMIASFFRGWEHYCTSYSIVKSNNNHEELINQARLEKDKWLSNKNFK